MYERGYTKNIMTTNMYFSENPKKNEECVREQIEKYKNHVENGTIYDTNDFVTYFTDDYTGILNEFDYERDHPLLVECVETLGDAASGKQSKLKIVEIPDDVEWEIAEYDGRESIEEKHRSWE